MTCVYCGSSHSAFDPCPEMLAAAQATVQKHTLGTHDVLTIKQLEQSVRVVESLMKTSRWTLVSPNGEMWSERDPKKLVSVLLQRMPLSFGSVNPRLQNLPNALTKQEWRDRISKKYLNAQFVEETGEGDTYGEKGTITAHIGPDMQSDVIGVWAPGSHCSIDDVDYEVSE